MVILCRLAHRHQRTSDLRRDVIDWAATRLNLTLNGQPNRYQLAAPEPALRPVVLATQKF